MNKVKTQLKKCPWCKNRPPKSMTCWDDYGSDAAVMCNKCFASGPNKRTKKEAREAWGLEVINGK